MAVCQAKMKVLEIGPILSFNAEEYSLKVKVDNIQFVKLKMRNDLGKEGCKKKLSEEISKGIRSKNKKELEKIKVGSIIQFKYSWRHGGGVCQPNCPEPKTYFYMD